MEPVNDIRILISGAGILIFFVSFIFAVINSISYSKVYQEFLISVKDPDDPEAKKHASAERLRKLRIRGWAIFAAAGFGILLILAAQILVARSIF